MTTESEVVPTEFDARVQVPGPETALATTTAGQQAKLSHLDTQTVAASSAGIRALLYQITYVYLRNPAKLFRPARFDYMASARALVSGELAGKPWSYRTHSSLAMIYRSVIKEGWRFVPIHVLPPIIANSAVGLVLYTSYLTSLQYFTGKGYRTITDPSPIDTFRAGLIAGALSSIIASPLDALYSRSAYAGLVKGRESVNNLVKYAVQKLKEIGPMNLGAGFGLTCLKESLGFAVYFSIFETIKNQGYHTTHRMIAYYERLKCRLLGIEDTVPEEKRKRSERALQLTFILFAGASAAVGLLAVQYPFNRIQKVHMDRLEAEDIFKEATSQPRHRILQWLQPYHKSYVDTFEIVKERYKKSKMPLLNFIYKGFVRNSLTSIPATSVGLLVFEISRQEFASRLDAEEFH